MEILDASYAGDREKALDSLNNGCWARCSFATCALIPPEAVEIALDVLYCIAIKNDTTDKFKVKPEDQEAFDMALKLQKIQEKRKKHLERKKKREAAPNNDTVDPAGFNTEAKLVKPNDGIELTNI